MLEDLSLKLITDITQPPFFNLHQYYEFEFSPLTGYETNEKGIYDQDILQETWCENHAVYKLSKQVIPIGFAVINLGSYISNDKDVCDVAEFFVMPRYRNKAIGNLMAKKIFNLHPGKWEVRQLLNATKARVFWLKVINEYTRGKFEEQKMNNAQWTGYVQCFITE